MAESTTPSNIEAAVSEANVNPNEISSDNSAELKSKLHELSEPDSDNESLLNLTGLGDSAQPKTLPSAKCPICLCRIKNSCYTNSCNHEFCFECLREWSKIKAECPLCKQNFKSIIHTITSRDQYEVYQVPNTPCQYVETNFNMMRQIDRNLSLLYTIDIPSNRRFAFSNSLHGGLQNSVGVTATATSRETMAHPNRLNRNVWREYVYNNSLYAVPLCDLNGHFRECSARIFRSNTALLDRVLPWISRDIRCLLRNNTDIYIMERMRFWLTRNNILSPLFRHSLQPLFGDKTAHFIHELYNFARSPYEIAEYDSIVLYSPHQFVDYPVGESAADYNRGHNESVANENIEADDNIVLINSRSMAGPIPNDTVVTSSTTPRTTAEMSQSSANVRNCNFASITLLGSANGIDNSDNQTVVASPNEPICTESPAPSKVIESIDLTTSSSDECEFVSEYEAPHQLTSLMGSCNSSEDISEKQSDDAEVPKNDDELTDEEYNTGPSTSAGLLSSGRRRRQESIDEELKIIKKLKRRKRTASSTLGSRVNMFLSDDNESTDDDEKATANIRLEPRKRSPKETIVVEDSNSRSTNERRVSGEKNEEFEERSITTFECNTPEGISYDDEVDDDTPDVQPWWDNPNNPLQSIIRSPRRLALFQLQTQHVGIFRGDLFEPYGNHQDDGLE